MLIRRYYKYKWGTAVKDDLRTHKALADRRVGHESLFRVSTVVEFFLTIVQPLPFIDYTFTLRAGYPPLDYQFTLSEVLYSLMFLKLYIILRYVISSSIYTNSDAKFLWYAYSNFLLFLL